MTQSLAFWVESSSNNTSSKLDVELHFNYWHLPDDKINYLDIGVLLSGEKKNFDSINIYLPFEFKPQNYMANLGDKITESDNLISAVFNNDVENKSLITPSSAYYITFLDKKSDNEILFFTNLSCNYDDRVIINNYENSHEAGFSIQFFKKIFQENKKYEHKNWYFRFRYILDKNDIDKISREYKANDSIITSYFEKSEVIDFRVNESRNLPKTLREKIATCNNVKKIHFFLIRNESSEFKMGHSAYDRCRILEDRLWEPYLCSQGQYKIKTKMLIYHWKTKSDTHIEHFSAFARFINRKVRTRDVVWIILAIIGLGVASSLIATYILGFFTSK
ncbi:hypothetical protein [Proteus vulgaris]|uniref:hypothetical protein n=1 Tax=Proteus vulgaris TaxID=585 RepID=UPI0034D6FBA8